MVHQRIRKYSAGKIWTDQDLSNDLCMVVRAGKMVFLRGQTGMDLDGKIHGIGDPGAQAENAMRCVKILLEEAGSKLDDICKVVIYITDRAYREPVYRAVGRCLKGVYPVSTGVIVQGLARPELLVEIDVFAVIPEGAGQATQGSVGAGADGDSRTRSTRRADSSPTGRTRRETDRQPD